MSLLSVPNSFSALQTILSASVNANFAAIVAWAAGNITDTNLGTMVGPITWSTTANVLNIVSANSGTEGSASFSHSGVLASGKKLFSISSSAAQTTGDAGLYLSFSSSSATIPLAQLSNAGTGFAFDLTQSGVLAANKAALSLTVSGAQTTGLGALYAILSNASSSVPLFRGKNAGTGALLSFADNSSNELYKLNSSGVVEYGGANVPGWMSNLKFAISTVTDANDTISIVTFAGSSASASAPGYVEVAGTILKVSAALTLTLTGLIPGLNGQGDEAGIPLYLYAINDSGTAKFGLSRKPYQKSITVANSSATASSVNAYAKMFVTSTLGGTCNCQQIGVVTGAFTDSGDTWALTNAYAGSSVQVADVISEVRYDTYAGYGGTDTKIPYFTNQRTLTGYALDVTSNNSTNGLRITVNDDGLYAVSFSIEGATNGLAIAGLSRNSSERTTDVTGITASTRLAIASARAAAASGTEVIASVSWTGFLSAGDIIRPHTTGVVPGGSSERCHFQMVKIG